MLAVYERRHGAASEEAHRAREALASACLDAGLAADAVHLLTLAVINASQLHGPDDLRTTETQIHFGAALIEAGHLHNAQRFHAHLLDEAIVRYGSDAPVVARIRAAAAATERALASDDPSYPWYLRWDGEPAERDDPGIATVGGFVAYRDRRSGQQRPG